MYYVKRPT